MANWGMNVLCRFMNVPTTLLLGVFCLYWYSAIAYEVFYVEKRATVTITQGNSVKRLPIDHATNLNILISENLELSIDIQDNKPMPTK